jgi:calcineurin-like phosphoesterase family protein
MDKKIFFIADTHFGHGNIIKYENRPFQDIYEMDHVLIENWNKVVNQGDEVFVLGDFSFYGKDKTKTICGSLKGRKTLIMGNHDTKTPDFYLECGFENVSRYPIIFNDFWMLSHEPLYINGNMPYANIFGHVHSSKVYADYSKQSFCACVERTEYTPVEFSRIKILMGISEENELEGIRMGMDKGFE